MTDPDARAWLAEQGVEWVEAVVPDMAGACRGKLLPVAHFSANHLKLPVAVFGQTVHGTYYMPAENAVDRDMHVTPDLSTLRLAPWTADPTATVMLDCYRADGRRVDIAPRAVLQGVLRQFAAKGWQPVVAPEVEFYLSTDPHAGGRDTGTGECVDATLLTDPYGTDRVHRFGKFFSELTHCCREQDIELGAVSQELGAGQFEINFEHGDPLKRADDVLHCKRTVKHLALRHGMRATFLAKLDSALPGSSLHLHQSVYDRAGGNIFSDANGMPSDAFHAYLGGLQQHLADFLLFLAPYHNSFRRFLSHWSSPVNLEWGIDNRTVGLRVPESAPDARRIENRLSGSDVNPYLAIAGTLACGFLGMTGKANCRPAIDTSAYELPFALHRHVYEALEALRRSRSARTMFGEAFVTQYVAVKEREFREFEARVPEWELRDLSMTV